MRNTPWQSRKALHLQLAASCGVHDGLPPWFSMHFKSIPTFLSKSANEKKSNSVDERWHLRSANSASIKSQSHWPSSGDRRLGAGMQRLASAGPPAAATAWMWWCILANKGFPNLVIVTKFSPLPELCDNGKTTTCGFVYVRGKVWMVRSTGVGAHKLFERIVRRRRDVRRLIPYRTRGTVARPASGHSCRPTSL